MLLGSPKHAEHWLRSLRSNLSVNIWQKVPEKSEKLLNLVNKQATLHSGRLCDHTCHMLQFLNRKWQVTTSLRNWNLVQRMVLLNVNYIYCMPAYQRCSLFLYIIGMCQNPVINLWQRNIAGMQRNIWQKKRQRIRYSMCGISTCLAVICKWQRNSALDWINSFKMSNRL